MKNYTLKDIRHLTLKIKSDSGGAFPTASDMRSQNRKLYYIILEEFHSYRTFRNWMQNPDNYQTAWSYTGDDSLLEYVQQRINPEFGLFMPTQPELQSHGHATFAAKACRYKNGMGMRELIKDCGMTTRHILPIMRTRKTIIAEARSISTGNPKILPSYKILRKYHGALLAAIQKEYSSLAEFAAIADLDYYPERQNWSTTMIIDALKALSGARNKWPGKWKVESVKGLYRVILRRGGPKVWCEKLGWTYGNLAADGEYYDSNAEVLVANLLMEHNISYQRFITNSQTDPYIPDFYLPDAGLFVEVLMCDCDKPQSGKVKKSYSMRWKAKRTQYHKNAVPFVTIKPNELDTSAGVTEILVKLRAPVSGSLQIQGPLRQKAIRGYGYWKNWSVVKQSMDEITVNTSYAPRRQFFFSPENMQAHPDLHLPNLYNAIHNHFGGLESVAERLDIPPAPDMPHIPGYWKQHDNVMLEYATACAIEGKAPTVYELQKSNQLSLVNAIIEHGGIDHIRLQLEHYLD